MLEYGIDRSRRLIRESMLNVKATEEKIDRVNVDSALDYFERLDDIAIVKEALKDRVAVGIRKSAEEGGYETYTKQRVAEMIEDGEIEIVSSGIGTKIINSLSNLFNSPTQSYEWTSESGEKDDNTAEIIKNHRKTGDYDNTMNNADFVSCAIESGPVLVGFSNGALTYQVFSPACMYALFHDTVMDNGIPRGTDARDIEDATVIAIQTSRNKGNDFIQENSYIAYFGRSNQYPLGRCVSYTARKWSDFPNIGEKRATDWTTKSGEIANPLSLIAEQTNGYYGVEYPIAIIKGGLTVTSDRLAPITMSLFRNCKEIDIAYSRLTKDALSAARGKDVLTNSEGSQLPRCLEGAVALQRGQTLEIMGQPASNSVEALNVIRGLTQSIAEGYSVPSYQVTEIASSPESGVALYIRTLPLIEHRERRAAINRGQVDRIYNIERALLECYTGKKIGLNTKQTWNHGRYVLPESEVEKVARLSAAQDKGYIDYVRAVRDFHNFPTDDEAIAFIEKMDERRATNPGPKPAGGARIFGLTARQNGGNQQV